LVQLRIAPQNPKTPPSFTELNSFSIFYLQIGLHEFLNKDLLITTFKPIIVFS